MEKEKSFSFFLSVALFLLFGLLSYSNTLNAPFYFDDYPNILFNPVILNFKGWAGLFNDIPTRSLGFLSFALNYKIGGTSPWGYHLVNLALHLANGMLVLGIGRLLMKTPVFRERAPSRETRDLISFGAALIFVCHPLQTQAVNYIVQRLTLLVSFWYMATVFAYLHFRIHKVRASYFLGLCTSLLGVISKENAFTLPAALLLCEVLFFAQDAGSVPGLIKRLLPFVLISLLIPALLFMNPNHMIQTGGQMALVPTLAKNISRVTYGITQLDVLGIYVGLLVVPVRQTFDYDFPFSNGFSRPETLGSLVLLIALLMLAFRLVRKQPLMSFGIFFFFLALSIESSIIPFPDPIFEHRLYLPMAGFAFFSAAGLARVIKTPGLFKGILIGLGLVLGILTYQRNAIWADELLFWQDQTRKAPLQSRGYFHLGEVYNKRHEYLLAAENFLKALSWRSSEWRRDIQFNNVGSAYANAGQISKAEYWYRKGLEAYPKSGPLYTNLAVLKMREGDLEGAASLLKMAIAAEPDSSIAQYELARLYVLKKEYKQAIPLLERTIARDPFLRPAKELLATLQEHERDQTGTQATARPEGLPEKPS